MSEDLRPLGDETVQHVATVFKSFSQEIDGQVQEKLTQLQTEQDKLERRLTDKLNQLSDALRDSHEENQRLTSEIDDWTRTGADLLGSNDPQDIEAVTPDLLRHAVQRIHTTYTQKLQALQRERQDAVEARGRAEERVKRLEQRITALQNERDNRPAPSPAEPPPWNTLVPLLERVLEAAKTQTHPPPQETDPTPDVAEENSVETIPEPEAGWRPVASRLALDFIQPTQYPYVFNGWIADLQTAETLHESLSWVLKDSRGERRDVVPPQWTTADLLANGDSLGGQAQVRVRATADETHWFVAFLHSGKGDEQWQTMMEAQAHKGGTLLRVRAGAIGSRHPRFVGAPPHHLRDAITRARHIDAGSKYPLGAFNMIREAGIQRWVQDVLESPERDYPLMLIGPDSPFPTDLMQTAPREKSWAGACPFLVFRLENNNVIRRVWTALATWQPEVHWGSPHRAQRHVTFVSVDGQPRSWDEGRVQAFIDAPGLWTALYQEALQADPRWLDVLHENGADQPQG